MALTAETESRLYRSLRAAAGAAAHLVALGFPTAVAVLARPGSSLFSWHPLLMALAFSFLMTEALLIFSPETSLLRSFSRKVKVRVHWALQLLALLCALLGLGIITYNKHLNGKAHFVTWHGLTGLLTVLYAGGQCMGGVLLLYPKLMKNWTLAKLKLYHATSGLVGYLLGCASLMLGMCSLWFTTSVTSISWYLAMLCPLLTSLVIMNQSWIACSVLSPGSSYDAHDTERAGATHLMPASVGMLPSTGLIWRRQDRSCHIPGEKGRESPLTQEAAAGTALPLVLRRQLGQ